MYKTTINKMDYLVYTEDDAQEICHLYERWIAYSNLLKQKFFSRGANIPEALSESILCYCFGYVRCLKKGGDCYNPSSAEIIESKATSIKIDATSFSPQLKWNKIYFVDFFKCLRVDKDKDKDILIYDLSSCDFSKIIMNKKKNQTFGAQQDLGRRPRFSIRNKIINPNNLQPIKIVNIYKLPFKKTIGVSKK